MAMEPLSIATGCVSLLTSVSKLSIQISAFVSSVRDARKDMGAVSGELSSLSLCLETLRDDSLKISYPDGFRENLLTVLRNCDMVTTEMTALLDKLSSASLLRKIQWTAMGRDDMNKLRSSLESHKSALEIGLDMTSLLLISAVKGDVADVKADTAQIPSIKQDTSQIEGLVQQIGLLRLQLDNGHVNDAKAQHLQMFLDQSTTYAETVIDAIEEEEEEEEEEDHLYLSHFITESFEEDGDMLVKPASTARTNHGISSQLAYQPPAARSAPGQDSATSVSSPSAILETALQNLEVNRRHGRQAQTRPIATATNVPPGRMLLPTRDQEAIEKATLLRNAMTLKEQEKLNKMLEVAIRGKKSLTDRLKSKHRWWSDERGSFDTIKDLLDRGSDPNRKSFDNDLCMLEMIGGKRVRVLELLLMRGATFTLSKAATWLIQAIRSDQKCFDLVSAFLKCGVSPNTKHFNNKSALTYATGSGDSQMVRLLLDSGDIADDKALDEAVHLRRDDIVKMLLENGASSITESGKEAAARNATLARQFETVKLLVGHGVLVGASAFFDIVSAGRADILKMLLDQGASENARNGGSIAIHEAVSRGHLDVVNLLLEHRAMVPSHLDFSDQVFLANGYTGAEIDRTKTELARIREEQNQMSLNEDA